MSIPPPPAPPAPPPAFGARVIVAAQLVRLVFRILSAAVLARLLTPAAYGLHGMAAIVYSLLYMVRDFGVFTAMQQPGLTPQRFNALCRFSLLGGLGLGAFCAALAWPAARFFGEPALPPVLATLGVALACGAASVPALAALYREGRTDLAVMAETGALVGAILAAIAAAAAGAGVWALVLLTVLTEALTLAAAWWLCPRRPGRDLAGTPWREVLGFGATLTGHRLASYLTRSLDQALVGRNAGAAELGFYGRGTQATTLVTQMAVAPFSGWAIATLAQRRDKPEEFLAHFRRLLNGLLHFSLATAAFCVAAPDFVVRFLYGERWLAAAEVVRWLGVATALQPWIFAQGWIFEARGAARKLLAISLVGLAVIGSACFAVRERGIVAIAVAVAGGTALQAIFGAVRCLRDTPARARDLLGPAVAPLALHGAIAGLLLALRCSFPAGAWWLPLPVGLGGYAGAWLALPVVRREVRDHFIWRS